MSALEQLEAETRNKKHHKGWKRKLPLIGGILVVLVILGFCWGMWSASSQIVSPAFRGASKNFDICKPETATYWGKDCGNLRKTHQFTFSEVQIPTVNGYKLPGWMIKTADNNKGASRGAIMLVPGGGSNRLENTRLVPFYLSQHLDVLTFDMSCQGEAPCPGHGLTYGNRESRDVESVYLYLTDTYDTVYAMGNSVGASSILIALPAMPKLKAVVAENPMYNFERLIKEAPQATSMPGFVSDIMLGLAKGRGNFDDLDSPATSLRLVKNTPILFIHSKKDTTVSYVQTEDLAKLYSGPDTVWLVNYGNHGEVWDANHAAYEKKVSDFLN